MSVELPLIASLPRPAGDGFAELRRRAHREFVARGLPGRRDEAWKYTDVGALGAESWPRARAGGAVLVPAPLHPQARRIIWRNGVIEGEKVDGMVQSLAGLAAQPPQPLAELLGRLAGDDDSLVALNTALFDHGAWIDVPAGTRLEAPLELLFAAGDHTQAASLHTRLAIRIGKDSRIVLIERHAGGGQTFATRVDEITLEAGAELVHVRSNEMAGDARLVGHTAVRLGARARYDYLGLDLGARLCRETLGVTLAATHASVRLTGLAILQGRRHADADVTVTHAARNTRSRQYFRGILDGRSRNVYSGRVRVEPGAQKTDAAQRSANLLLSRGAEADSRPQLEIYADDVACSHGSATGAVDPDAMFYLQSRGLDAAAARRLIAYGFAAHAFREFSERTLERGLAELAAGRLEAPPEVREWL